MKKYHLSVICFHCNKDMEQRKDTVERQLLKYGHSCCKNCFGKEQSFKDARSAVMTENNPFKGKKHSQQTKDAIAALKTGSTSWNKGLDKKMDDRIKKYGENISLLKTGKQIGEQNPNWRGGNIKTKLFFIRLKEWLKFRKEVLERDCHGCWKCGDFHRLEVHHLMSRALHPEREFDELNCIVLCRKCHIEFHKIYGKKTFLYHHTIRWINSTRSEAGQLVMN